MWTGYCHHTRKRLSTNIFDIMKLKFLFHLNSDSPKYISKLFSLSVLHAVRVNMLVKHNCLLFESHAGLEYSLSANIEY